MCNLKSKGPSWSTIIKCAIEPSLLFVTWFSATKHWRESVKMADERERKWNLLGVSKHYNWSLA